LDADGVSNADERLHGSDPQRKDTDFDGLTDGEELEKWFTDPVILDTDGDGIWDGDEVAAGSDPSDAESLPTTSPQSPPPKGGSPAISNP
jgi:hypothetical protein